jgi:hypothetical protein
MAIVIVYILKINKFVGAFEQYIQCELMHAIEG